MGVFYECKNGKLWTISEWTSDGEITIKTDQQQVQHGSIAHEVIDA